MSAPLFQHRQFKIIASILAEIVQSERSVDIVRVFADRLASTNPNFDRERFISAAMGAPCNGRDKVRS